MLDLQTETGARMKMKKLPYYHAHESAYKNIKEKGYVGWGNVKTLEELNSKETHDILKSIVKEWIIDPKGKKALDLGCGTGTTAFTLAKLGLEVSGIDISETAIELAKTLAKKQNLKIQFQVNDVLLLKQLSDKFDFIYDSHCLHCIVFDDDRRRVLDGIRHVLNDGGIFFLDTMALGDNTIATGGLESLRFDDDHILWHKTYSYNYYGIVELENQNWCAQRRIYPSGKILEEITQAGFKIHSESLVKHEPTAPWMLRLVLSAK
jgi:2-polyprenyl-3-methyl-5-hydroxy-6-metoxy-1,4-benzoquinol methylase